MLKVRVKNRVLIDNIKKYSPASEITDDGILEVTDWPAHDDCYKTKCRHVIYKKDCQVIEEVKEPLQTPTGSNGLMCALSIMGQEFHIPNTICIHKCGKDNINCLTTCSKQEFKDWYPNEYKKHFKDCVITLNEMHDGSWFCPEEGRLYKGNPNVGFAPGPFVEAGKDEPINGGSNLGTPILEEAGKIPPVETNDPGLHGYKNHWVKEAEEKMINSIQKHIEDEFCRTHDILMEELKNEKEGKKRKFQGFMDLINEDKKYVFNVHLNGFNAPERYEKTESELTASERDLLLGNLIRMWEQNTSTERERFCKKYKLQNVSLTNKGDNYYPSENEVAEWIKMHDENISYDQNTKLAIFAFYYWMKGGNR